SGPAGSAGSSATATAGAVPSARAVPAPAAKSAPALLRDALAALRSGGSVHVDITNSSPQGSVAYSDDATAGGGRQVITIGGTGHVTILFIAGVGYVKGDARGLAALFTLPELQADQFADQWIALRRGDKLGLSTYDDVTAGITLSSVAAELAPGNAVTLAAPTTIEGQRVVGVQASLPADEQLPSTARDVIYLTDNSLLRPVLSEVTNAGSYKYQMSFGDWGERLHLTAPANAIPASSVTPSTPSTNIA
ncbi:MAG: hypothetical protein ACRDNS_30865, partial [Trebonia sp.]